MKNCIILLILYILIPITSFSQSNIQKAVVDSMLQSFQSEIEKLKQEFGEYSQNALVEYELYEKQARADYLNYVQSIQRIWGEDSVRDNTRNQWVEYSDNYSSRSIVDFKTGNVVVEVALDDNIKSQSVVNERLEGAVERLLNSRGSTSPYPSSVEISAPLTIYPVLKNLIDFSSLAMDTTLVLSRRPEKKNSSSLIPQPIVRSKNLSDSILSSKNQVSLLDDSSVINTSKIKESTLSDFNSRIAKKIVKSKKKIKDKIKGTDGKIRQIYQVEMALVSDNLSRNAALYKDFVFEFSEKYQIEQPLIYAIIEQESYFNPEATSWVPAYGLMQIVPKSGGRDAYRFVYKKDWIPTRSYLYNPRNNIELGTAYLRVLMNQFDPVINHQCRRLCVIASYNTGAGNVSRSFIGTTNLSKAFDNINLFDYNQLYDHLITRLPYEETRDYVIKVTNKREKYIK